MAGTMVTLAGKQRMLRLDATVLEEMETRAGRSTGSLLTDFGLSSLKWFLWAGLRHEEPRLTPERARELLTRHVDAGGYLEDVGVAITQEIARCGVFRVREAVEALDGGTPPGEAPSPGPGASEPG